MEKRLYRSRTDSILCGVCGGMAKYFGVDSGIVRVILFIMFVMGTIGLWVYIVLAIIIPKEPEAGYMDRSGLYGGNSNDMYGDNGYNGGNGYPNAYPNGNAYPNAGYQNNYQNNYQNGYPNGYNPNLNGYNPNANGYNPNVNGAPSYPNAGFAPYQNYGSGNPNGFYGAPGMPNVQNPQNADPQDGGNDNAGGGTPLM